jgi:SAM-dependent methyltransferase
LTGRIELDLFYGTYGHFHDAALDAVRKETFGEDIGQNSWVTADEYARFVSWLDLKPEHHAIEIASGSGGPALYLARTSGCRVTGVDSNESGVATANGMAERSGQAERVRFTVADATARLPFEAETFDGLLCIDSMNHFPNRLEVLRDWNRVLRAGRRAIFTDPVVISGPVTNDELALRSSIGLFLFVPPGINEALIEEAGFRLLRRKDVTENAARVAERWGAARQAHRDELLSIEGEERFESLQRFFDAVHRLTSEKRLSRIAYLAEKDGGEE